MVAGVYAALDASDTPTRFTVGINDDVSGTSLDYDPSLDIEDAETLRAVFFGLGSDGTVGANKNTIKILGAAADVFAQAYFVYDSKKSGAVTVSHLRFGPHDIRAPYLVTSAGFVGCHHLGLLEKLDVLAVAKPGGTVLLNAPMPPGPGLGRPARAGAGAAGRQGAAAVRHRRRPGGPRRRAPGPHQHRAADLLLRDLRRAPGRRRDPPGQGGDPQDLRAAGRRGRHPQRGRGRRRARRPARGRRPRREHVLPAAARRGARRRRRSSSAP